MLQLADIKPVIKESKMSLSNFELVKNSVDGNTYAIVRENKKYHIKQAQTKENLVESDFDYVGGVANKMKKSFNSFSEATRGLNFMFEEINNHYENNGTNILESDDVLSEKKFVLKLNKKKKTEPAPPTEEPMEEPAAEEGGEEEFDFGGEEDTEGGEEDTEGGEEFDFGGEEDTEEGGEEDFDFGGEEGETEEGGEEETDVDEFGGEEDEDLELDDSEDEIKDIQSTTGKLGQQLRDVEDISSDMQKWVAKSVLSALDLENMDSEDKKDIIKTVKKKSEKPAEEESSEEEFDFGGEEEMEESYDNYMGYDDDMDGMNEIDWENGMSEYGVSEYDSHMGEKTMERIDAFLEDMEEVGVLDSSNTYDSYMDDDADLALALDRPNPDLIEGDEDTELGGDEEDKVAKPDDKNVDDKLLLDVDMEFPSYEDVYSDEEMDALYGPNNKKYDRSGSSRARRQADKDISKHYYKPSAPGYESDPVDKWAKHKLPYDMLDESYMTEDHLNSEMETYEQEKAYEDVEAVVKRYGMGVELRKKDTSEDPEETVVYLDIINDAGDKVLVSRINSVGDIEVGEMKGNKFSGEPLDSVEDFIEIFGEDLTSKERKELDMAEDIEMSPAPQRAPEKQPNEPATKPGRPERKSPSERPSRRPFTPPPTITPGEEPGPKAADDDVEFE
jgi:hypothetical protein